MKNLKTFEEFDWSLGLGKKEKPKSNYINDSEQGYPVKVSDNNYDNCEDVITKILSKKNKVVLQVMGGGEENFEKLLKNLDLKASESEGTDKPWFYVEVKYKK